MDHPQGLPAPIESVTQPVLPPQSDINEFKVKVKRWLTIDGEMNADAARTDPGERSPCTRPVI